MAQDTCTITIIGRLGRDPEMRYLPDGTAVTSFSVAVNKRDDRTVWYRVSAFGKLGEICNQYLAKGKQVLIIGDHDYREYTNNDGETRYSNEIRAVNMQMLGKKDDAVSNDEETPTEQPAPVATKKQPEKPVTAPRRNVPRPIETEDDIPF